MYIIYCSLRSQKKAQRFLMDIIPPQWVTFMMNDKPCIAACLALMGAVLAAWLSA